MIDIENALQLEFYKQKETFKGDITLDNNKGTYEPSTKNGTSAPEKKEPLEEVINRINELFNGKVKDADRLIRDKSKYAAIMTALAEALYKEFNN